MSKKVLTVIETAIQKADSSYFFENYTKQAQAGQVSRAVLAGAGLGLRVAAARGTALQLDAARALTDGDIAGGGTRRGNWRVHGRVSMEF